MMYHTSRTQRIVLRIHNNNSISNRIKTRKERKYSFPIRAVLLHRLKVRMMPFKTKHAKIIMEKFMDIVALFITPLSYVTFKNLWNEYPGVYFLGAIGDRCMCLIVVVLVLCESKAKQ